MNKINNDIVSQWNAANARDFEARLQAAAAEAAPRKPSRLGRALAFLAVCGACFVPAAVIGYVNGGFETAHAAPVAAQVAAPAPAAEEAPEAAPEAPVVLDEVVIAAKAPKAKPAHKPTARAPRKAKRCWDHELRMGGSPDAPTVRVCAR